MKNDQVDIRAGLQRCSDNFSKEKLMFYFELCGNSHSGPPSLLYPEEVQSVLVDFSSFAVQTWRVRLYRGSELN